MLRLGLDLETDVNEDVEMKKIKEEENTENNNDEIEMEALD